MPARANRDPYTQGLELSAKNRHFEAIECFEEALAQRPNDVRALFALGNTASALGMAKPAETFFRQVLTLEPGRIEALVNLANLLRAQGEFEAAQALLLPAIARDAAVPELWLTLGSVHREMGDNAPATRCYREALKLRPDYPPALGNLADILADEGEIEDALALYDHVIGCNPGNAQARLNRAIVHLLTGNLREGWRDYSARLDIKGKVPLADRPIAPWKGIGLRNLRLLVRAEQGVGDQIMFASVVPELAARAEQEGGKILLECDARLVSLFSRSFPTVKVRPSRIETRGGTVTARYDWLKADGGANAAILLGSLPRVLRDDVSCFSAPHRFLKPDQHEVSSWRDRFRASGQGPRIGICWRSSARGGSRAVQYAPLATWAQFIRGLPGPVVSAQYDATDDEISELEILSGRQLVVPQALDQKNELDRTCAMLHSLDAVVSAPTAVSWLAAAAGTPTFKILYDTSWTSFGCDHEPFAPSAVLMMPRTRGDWGDAFAKARMRVSALHEQA